MPRIYKPAFAVVRVDEFHDATTPWNIRITVKEVVQTEKEAQEEVERLSEVNRGKQCQYFWQHTRVLQKNSIGDSHARAKNA